MTTYLLTTTNISNMTLTATKRQSNNNSNDDDVELVPTLEEKQAYINQLASQTAAAMSNTQECTLPTRRISSGTASNTLTTCDDHTEEEEDLSSPSPSVHQMEISFPDICCPHHSYVHLKRYSTKTNKWLTLLEECPVCYKLQLSSLLKEVDDQSIHQRQKQKKQPQQHQQQQQELKEKEVEEEVKVQKKERRRSKSRRRSSTSSQGSNRSSSYNKIFKIEGQYVLSL